MRLSQRKIIAWFLLTVMSLNPLLELHAIDAAPPKPMTACQIALADDGNATPSAGSGAEMNCAQHHACISYCQFAPLLFAGAQQVQVSPLLWLVIPDQAENLNSRFLENIERPPRV